MHIICTFHVHTHTHVCLLNRTLQGLQLLVADAWLIKGKPHAMIVLHLDGLFICLRQSDAS